MKKSKRCAILVLTALMLLLLLLAGCGSEKSGNTISEPEITVDYLDGEYADQLINDGAGTMLGTVSVEQSGDSYIAHVTEKEVVRIPMTATTLLIPMCPKISPLARAQE